MNRFFALLLLFSLLLCSCKEEPKKEYNDPYNPAAAVAYSYQYATARNPEYADFQTNCTNYISQILIAGGKEPDEAIPPKEDVRITYHDRKDRWFSAYTETEPARWKEFSVSTSFCRTDDFIDYWTDIRKMELTQYSNNIQGLKQLYAKAQVGDIIVLYNAEGETVHLCFLAVRKNMQLLVNANTNDYYEHNVMQISPTDYPTIGLLSIR